MVPTAFSTGMTQPLDPAEARDGILTTVSGYPYLAILNPDVSVDST